MNDNEIHSELESLRVRLRSAESRLTQRTGERDHAYQRIEELRGDAETSREITVILFELLEEIEKHLDAVYTSGRKQLTTGELLARVTAYLGTRNATPEQLAIIRRVKAMQKSPEAQAREVARQRLRDFVDGERACRAPLLAGEFLDAIEVLLRG